MVAVVFEDWEIRLIQAMKASGDWTDQAIQAVLSTRERNFSTGRLSEKEWLLQEIKASGPATSPDGLALFSEQIERFGRDEVLPLYRGGRPVVQVDYHFMPVGQGLFAAGQLRQIGAEPFRWVYDCGTDSSQNLIKTALDQCPAVLPKARPKERLDLLALSHFDEDHISGVVRLLDRVQVRWCLLPYLAPWDRLVLLAKASDLATDYGRFLLDPAGFLRERGVERVILVPASDEPRPPPEAERPPPREPEPFHKLQVPTLDQPSVHVQLDDAQMRHDAWVLRPGAGVSVLGLWEFVPYVDPKFRLAFGAAFRAQAEKLAAAFLATPDDTRLADLKAWYSRHIASLPGQTTGATANNISMHLYAGPLGRIEASPMAVSARIGLATGVRSFQQSGPDLWRIGVMLTGDADLRKTKGLPGFLNFFGAHCRLAKAGVFQVPHHGSRYNWKQGQAAALAPRVSVFSSGETGFPPVSKRSGHPHFEVWNDFFAFTPARVNSADACHVCALFTPVAI